MTRRKARSYTAVEDFIGDVYRAAPPEKRRRLASS